MIRSLPVFVFLSVLVLINSNILSGSSVKVKQAMFAGAGGVSVFSKVGNAENAFAAFASFAAYPNGETIIAGGFVLIQPTGQGCEKFKQKKCFAR